MKLRLFSTAIFVFNFIVTHAQDNIDSILTYTSDSIVVEATRYSIPLNEAPYSLEVIDLETIQKSANPISLAEILHTKAGIFVNNRNNLSQGDKITIRGIGTRAQFGIRGIKIFLDGIPLTFTDGQSQLNNLNVQDIETIEILKGPSSVLYGNALGGAIFIKSRINFKKRINVGAKIILGSYGLKKINLHSSAKLGINGQLKLSAYSLDQDGFRQHSDSKVYGLNFISNFQLSNKINISLIGNYSNSPYLLNPSTLNKIESRENPESVRSSTISFGLAKKVEQFQSGIVLDYKISNSSQIKSTIFFASRSLLNSIPSRYIDLNRNFAGLRFEYKDQLRLFNKNLLLLIGMDYEFQKDKRKEFVNEGIKENVTISPNEIFDQINYTTELINQYEEVKSTGIFAHLKYELTNQFILFSGLRYDDYRFEVNDKLFVNNFENSDNLKTGNTTLMIGFNYNLQNNLILYGNISSGFQTPTTNELSNNPDGDGGFNKGLKPEKVNNFEIGIKGWIDKINLLSSVSVYYMNFYDLLAGYQSATEEEFYRNIGKADNIGADINFSFDVSDKLKLISSCSFMDFRFTDYSISQKSKNDVTELQLKNKYVPGVPNQRASFVIQNYFTYNFYLALHFNYVGKYFTNDFNGPTDAALYYKNDFVNDAYSTFDLNANYKINWRRYSLVLGFKIDNIFDERYNGSVVPNAFGKNFFEPAPDRSYLLSLELVL